MTLDVSQHGDFFATPTVVGTSTGTPPAASPPQPARRSWLAVASVVTVIAVVAGSFVVHGWLTNRAPHGPSTGIQATATLHVVFPASLDGYTLESGMSQRLTAALAPLQAHVPALALSTQVQYRRQRDTVFIAGGPLPTALRFSGNAAQAALVKQIGEQIGGPKGQTPEGWEAKPAGVLGGQLWCGSPKILPGATDALCYAVDSQNVLIISTIGGDVSFAQQIRPLVEVTGG
jgi:hypothetical protein